MGPEKVNIKWVHPEDANIGNISHLGEMQWVQDHKNAGKLIGIQKISVTVPCEDDVQQVFDYEIKIYNISDSKKGKIRALKKIDRQLKKMSSLAILFGANDVKKIVYKKGSYTRKWENHPDSKTKAIPTSNIKKLAPERLTKINTKETKDANWKNSKKTHLKLATIVQDYIRLNSKNKKNEASHSKPLSESMSESSTSLPMPKKNSNSDTSTDFDSSTDTDSYSDTSKDLELYCDSFSDLESLRDSESTEISSDSKKGVHKNNLKNEAKGNCVNKKDVNNSSSDDSDPDATVSELSSNSVKSESSQNLINKNELKFLPKPQKLNDIKDAVKYVEDIFKACGKSSNIKDFILGADDFKNLKKAEKIFEKEPNLTDYEKTLHQYLKNILTEIDSTSEQVETSTDQESIDTSKSKELKNLPKQKKIENLDDATQYLFWLSCILNLNNIDDFHFDETDIKSLLKAKKIFDKEKNLNNQQKELKNFLNQILTKLGVNIDSSEKMDSSSDSIENSVSKSQEISEISSKDKIHLPKFKVKDFKSAKKYVEAIEKLLKHSKTKDIQVDKEDIENLLNAKKFFAKAAKKYPTLVNKLNRKLERICNILKVNLSDEFKAESSIEESSMHSKDEESSDSDNTSSSYEIEIKKKENSSTHSSENDLDEMSESELEPNLEPEPKLEPKLEPEPVQNNENSGIPIPKFNEQETKVINNIARNLNSPLKRKFDFHNKSINILKTGNTEQKNQVIEKYAKILKNSAKFKALKKDVQAKIVLNHHEEKIIESLKEMMDVGYTLYNICKIREAEELIKFSLLKLREISRNENQEELLKRNGRNSAKQALVLLRDRGFIFKEGNEWMPRCSLKEIANLKGKNSYNQIKMPFEYDFITNLPHLVEKEKDYQQKRKKTKSL